MLFKNKFTYNFTVLKAQKQPISFLGKAKDCWNKII